MGDRKESVIVLLQDLRAHQLIKRQQAVRKLKKQVSEKNGPSVSKIEEEISAILEDEKATWQAKHGALLASQAMVEIGRLDKK